MDDAGDEGVRVLVGLHRKGGKTLRKTSDFLKSMFEVN